MGSQDTQLHLNIKRAAVFPVGGRGRGPAVHCEVAQGPSPGLGCFPQHDRWRDLPSSVRTGLGEEENTPRRPRQMPQGPEWTLGSRDPTHWAGGMVHEKDTAKPGHLRGQGSSKTVQAGGRL